eukprot:1156038-Pelagomonas_calceolata.AAC.6
MYTMTHPHRVDWTHKGPPMQQGATWTYPCVTRPKGTGTRECAHSQVTLSGVPLKEVRAGVRCQAACVNLSAHGQPQASQTKGVKGAKHHAPGRPHRVGPSGVDMRMAPHGDETPYHTFQTHLNKPKPSMCR